MMFDWKRRLHGRVYRDDGGGGDGGGGHDGGDGGDGGDGDGSDGGFGGSGVSGDTAADVGSISLGGLNSIGMASDPAATGTDINGAAVNGLSGLSAAPSSLSLGQLGKMALSALEGFAIGGPVGSAIAGGVSYAGTSVPGAQSLENGILSGTPFGALLGLASFANQNQNSTPSSPAGSLDASGGGQGYSTNGFTGTPSSSTSSNVSSELEDLLAGLSGSGSASSIAGAELANPAVSALSQYNQRDQGTSNVQSSATSLGFGNNTASPGFGNPPSLNSLFSQSGTNQGQQNG